MNLLSPSEKALLDGNHNFTTAKQRYLRYRIRRKLRLLDEQSRSAAAALQLRCNGPNNLLLKQAGPRGFDPLTCGSEDLPLYFGHFTDP